MITTGWERISLYNNILKRKPDYDIHDLYIAILISTVDITIKRKSNELHR